MKEMLENIHHVHELQGIARAKSKHVMSKSVHPKLVEESLADGWAVERRHQRSVRLFMDKPHGLDFEDVVWTLFYKMGFPLMSGQGGGQLVSVSPEKTRTQIDVVAIDDEIAIAIECKSSENLRNRPNFAEELGKHALIQRSFARAVNLQWPKENKRRAVLAFFVNNITLSEHDRQRAKAAGVQVFDQNDVAYYQNLVSHLGPAARYQLLADMLPGKTVPGLEIRVPAVRTKIGSHNCYTFAMTPEYLLKISYVSHRAKGKASDVNTYQRMLTKSRLKKIRAYINEGGVFPTNIVVNLDAKGLDFQRIHQETDKETQESSGVLGWLRIVPGYKSAWIIDGQHRLFAYSGHESAAVSHLSVLAFEGLPASMQAELFIDINAEQKRVKQSLLQELYAELHWDAEDPQVRVRAIVSKAIQALDADPSSPLYQRVRLADASKSALRCISLTSVYGAIEKAQFHIAKERHGKIIDYGPLWAGDNDATLRRTVYVLGNWLEIISARAHDWWAIGSAEGGGLSMNDGVIACIDVLRSVFAHLEANGQRMVRLGDSDVVECVKKYAAALGDYLASLSAEQRKAFRDLRGIQGQTTRRRWCERALHDRFSDFDPPGLQNFLEEERQQTNIRAKEIIDRIEMTLQSVILDELRREFGPNESEWWVVGVPKNIRVKVTQRAEEDDHKRGGKEHYFDLMDYKKIVIEHWKLLEPLLGAPIKGNKEKRTAWMADVNSIRNLVSHASSGVSVSIERLGELRSYENWLIRAGAEGLERSIMEISESDILEVSDSV